MTRLAVLADIHGNLPALEAVIADMEAQQPDHVLALGDLINGVPFDAEVMQTAVGRGWGVIRGNHEFYLLDYGTPQERPNMRLSPSPAWLDRNLRDWLPTIAALPDTLTLAYRDGPPVYVTHGLPGNPYNAVGRVTPDETITAWFRDIEPDLVLCGHVHLPIDRQVGRRRVLNPGPVGGLLDGTHDACYLLLDAAGDHWEPTFRRVTYDFERVERAFREHDLDHILGVEGMLKCEAVRRARPTIPAFEKWMKMYHSGERWSYVRAHEYLSLPLESVWETIDAGYQVNPEIGLPKPAMDAAAAREADGG